MTLLTLFLFYGCAKPVKFVDETLAGAIMTVLKPVGDGISYVHDSVLGEEKRENKLPKETKKKEIKQILNKKETLIDKPRSYSKIRILADMAQLKESIRLNSTLSLGRAANKYGGKEGITKHKKEVEVFMRQNCSDFALEKKRQFSHLDIYDFTLSNCNNLATKDLEMF